MEDARPHNRRFPRPEQEIVWAAIQALDIADRLVILRELATEVATQGVKRGNEYDKVRAAVISLRDAAEILGKSPSQYEYRRLREHSSELDLVSDSNVRRWLGNGTWNDGLRRALLDAVSDGDFVTRAKGDRFTEDELLTAIKEYMSEHDGRVPTWPHYVMWARSPLVRERPGRRPLSSTPFTRLGGFRDLLLRNGLVSAGETRFDERGRTLPLKWRYTDEELCAAVIRVANEIGQLPTQTEYQRFRETSTGLMPSASALTQRFGGNWTAVIEHVSQPQPSGQPTLSGKTAPYTGEELIAALREAWADVGEPFSKNAYKRWRRAKLAAANTSDATRIPHPDVIAAKFGGWPEAIEAALPSGVRKRRRRKTYSDE